MRGTSRPSDYVRDDAARPRRSAAGTVRHGDRFGPDGELLVEGNPFRGPDGKIRAHVRCTVCGHPDTPRVTHLLSGSVSTCRKCRERKKWNRNPSYGTRKAGGRP